MNQALLQIYIDEYEKYFTQIRDQEIYKWGAVKQFQNSWNLGVSDFAKMLSIALSKTGNLMGSGNYYPRRVIVRNAEKNPQVVKTAFRDLYVEDIDVIERIVNFRKQIKDINSREFPGLNDF